MSGIILRCDRFELTIDSYVFRSDGFKLRREAIAHLYALSGSGADELLYLLGGLQNLRGHTKPATLHADRIASIADAILHLKTVDEFDRAKHAFGPNADQERVERLRTSWAATPGIGPSEIAAAFRGAAEVTMLMDGSGTIELVWTGPKTGLIPTRRTEQVILEVIDSAKDDVFLVTYVFYEASSSVDALNAAVGRGVGVNVLLESSIEHGGAVKGDSPVTLSLQLNSDFVLV